MAVNFIFLLLAIGVCSMFIPRRKKSISFLWGILIFAACAFSIASLAGFYHFPEFSFVWNALPNHPVAISFFLKNISRFGTIGIIALSMAAVYCTLLSADEPEKNILNGMIIINCVLVISALCAVNYIQLLAAVGVADVVVYSTINLPEAKRQYIFGNFLSDFMLLGILALILGQRGDITISGIDEHSRFLRHRDYIAIMLLCCIFIKTGTALFHTAYQKMADLNFARLNFILFAATPVMGLIILQLLKNILNISQYSYPLLKIFTIAGILWGCTGTVAADNLKRKAVYAAMFFWGLAFAGFIWLPIFSNRRFYMFLTSAFLFNNVLMMIVKAGGGQTQMSSLRGVLHTSKTTLTAGILSVVLYAAAWWTFAEKNIWLAVAGLAAFALISAHILSDAYFPGMEQKQPLKAQKTPFLLYLLPVATLIWLWSQNKHILQLWPYIVGCLMVWISIFIARPLQFTSRLYAVDFVQKNDVISKMYRFCVLVPLQVFGRVLQLIIDFIFVERTVIASIKHAIRFMIFIFKRLHGEAVRNYAFFILLAAAVVAIAYYGGVIK